MQRGPVVMLSILAAAGGIAALVHLAHGRRLPSHPFELAPVGTTGVLRVDVPALRASPLWQAWVGEGDEGYQRIVEDCGFDPLADLRTADVYVVGTERRPLDQIGFVARGALRHEALVRCVERVTEGEDFGGVHEEDIEGVRAIASDHGTSRAAFLGPDGVVGGDEPFVRDVIRRFHGEGPSLLEDDTLAELWHRASAREDVVLAMRLPESWRAGLIRMLGADGPAAALASAIAVGLGARLRSGLGATLVVELGSGDDARDARSALREWVDGLLARPLVRLSSIGGALRSVDAEADGARLVVTADLDEDELAAVVAYVREELAGLLEPAAPEPLPEPRPEPLPEEGALPAPDETVLPRSAAGAWTEAHE